MIGKFFDCVAVTSLVTLFLLIVMEYHNLPEGTSYTTYVVVYFGGILTGSLALYFYKTFDN